MTTDDDAVAAAAAAVAAPAARRRALKPWLVAAAALLLAVLVFEALRGLWHELDYAHVAAVIRAVPSNDVGLALLAVAASCTALIGCDRSALRCAGATVQPRCQLLLHRRMRALVALVLASSFSVASAVTVQTTLRERYEDFRVWTEAADRRDHRKFVEEAGRRYEAARGATAVGTLDGAALDAAFDLAFLGVFYTSSDRSMDDLTSISSRLESTGRWSRRHALGLFESYVRTRRFDEAGALAAAEGIEGDPIPRDIHGRRGPARFGYWRMDGADRLSRHSAEVGKVDLIVVLDPGCAASRRFVDDMRTDPVLGSRIRAQRVLWLAPPSGRLRAAEFADWNARSPDAQLVLANRTEDWPMVNYWGTPAFVALRDAEPIATVIGWPQGGRRAELDGILEAVARP